MKMGLLQIWDFLYPGCDADLSQNLIISTVPQARIIKNSDRQKMHTPKT